MLGSAMTLHVGVVTQDNVPEGKYRYNAMTKALSIFKDWLAEKNNIIGKTTVDIIWHMADGQQNTTELRRIGPSLVAGTWNDSYYDGKLVTEQYRGSEPPMAPCDVIIIEAWSDIFPSFLEGLSEAGIRVPVYAAGSCGKGVYINEDGSEKWDFTVNGLELADKAFSSIFHELYLRGSKSVILFEEADGGPWLASLSNYVRTFSRNKEGMQLLVDEQITIQRCDLLTNDQEITSCYEDVFPMIAKYLEPLKNGKRPRSYHADIFVFVGSWWMCDDFMSAIYRLLINFRAIVMTNWCMAAEKPLLKDSPRYVKDFDYVWTPTGFSSMMQGYHFDERFSSAAIFEDHGWASPAQFAEKWFERWGPDLGYDYEHAWTMAAFYYLWRDITFSYGDKAKIIQSFDDYRSPITSYMGLLGSNTGGWNPFHKWLGLQYFPNEDPFPLKGSRVVAPAEYAERYGAYPMPLWQDRECLPDNCDECPKCTELERVQVFYYLAFELPLVAIAIGLYIFHKSQPFNIIASFCALASVAVLVFKNLTNFIGMYIMFLKHDAGVIDDTSNAIFQCIFTSISIMFTISTIYTTAVLEVYKYQQDRLELYHESKTPDSSRKVPRVKKLIVMEYMIELRKLVSCIPGMGILIVQLIAVFYMKVESSALLLALLMNAYGIGGSLKSLAISNQIAECGQYEGLPMKKGVSSKIKAVSALNPFWTAFTFMKAMLIHWTRCELDNTTVVVVGHGDIAAYNATEEDIKFIRGFKTMSEIETYLAELGNKVKRTSIKQKSL